MNPKDTNLHDTFFTMLAEIVQQQQLQLHVGSQRWVAAVPQIHCKAQMICDNGKNQKITE